MPSHLATQEEARRIVTLFRSALIGTLMREQLSEYNATARLEAELDFYRDLV